MEAYRCIIPGCHKRRCIEGDVRHPYCSKTHADEGKRRKIFLPEEEECILPECHREKRKEGDIQHDYCSKTHAKEGKQLGLLSSRKRPPSASNSTVKRKPLQDENYLPASAIQTRTNVARTCSRSLSRCQVEWFLNSKNVTGIFQYCDLKSDVILGELKNNGIIDREQQQMMSKSVQVTANMIVHETLLKTCSKNKLKTLSEVLMESESSDANQELASEITTFLQAGSHSEEKSAENK